MNVVINPKITVDYERCTTPFDCKRCIRICPPAVFVVYDIESHRGYEVDKKQPGTYKMLPLYRDKCTGCMKCVEVCPVDALTVKMPEEMLT
ncbi:MAG: 4Fe-4S binding protein [Chloroflexi bacterium]|nr:4Fe-4S binding protein [Chloroflexota bacterium]